MHEPIQNGIRQDGITDCGVPIVHLQLAGKCGSADISRTSVEIVTGDG